MINKEYISSKGINRKLIGTNKESQFEFAKKRDKEYISSKGIRELLVIGTNKESHFEIVKKTTP